MDEVLRGLDFCYAYIDNILVALSVEKHLEYLQMLFEDVWCYQSGEARIRGNGSQVWIFGDR